MKRLSTGNITFMSDIEGFNFEYIQDRFASAVNFLHNMGLEVHDFYLDIIIPQNIIEMVSSYVEDFIPGAHNNAYLINRYQIRNITKEKKDVMIFNWNLCWNLTPQLIDFIMVHELVHYLDFKHIESFNLELGVKIYSQEETKSLTVQTLEQFYLARTELRANYYDEVFLMMNNLGPSFIDQEKVITDKVRDITFTIPRLIAKINCWQKFNLYPDSITEAISYLNTASNFASNWAVNISHSFEYQNFIQLSRNIIQSHK